MPDYPVRDGEGDVIVADAPFTPDDEYPVRDANGEIIIGDAPFTPDDEYPVRDANGEIVIGDEPFTQVGQYPVLDANGEIIIPGGDDAPTLQDFIAQLIALGWTNLYMPGNPLNTIDDTDPDNIEIETLADLIGSTPLPSNNGVGHPFLRFNGNDVLINGVQGWTPANQDRVFDPTIQARSVLIEVLQNGMVPAPHSLPSRSINTAIGQGTGLYFGFADQGDGNAEVFRGSDNFYLDGLPIGNGTSAVETQGALYTALEHTKHSLTGTSANMFSMDWVGRGRSRISSSIYSIVLMSSNEITPANLITTQAILDNPDFISVSS